MCFIVGIRLNYLPLEIERVNLARHASKVINSNFPLASASIQDCQVDHFVNTSEYPLITVQFPRKPWLCWNFVQGEGNSRFGDGGEVMSSKGCVHVVSGIRTLPFIY